MRSAPIASYALAQFVVVGYWAYRVSVEALRGTALFAQRPLRGVRMAADGHGRVRVRCAVVGSE